MDLYKNYAMHALIIATKAELKADYLASMLLTNEQKAEFENTFEEKVKQRISDVFRNIEKLILENPRDAFVVN